MKRPRRPEHCRFANARADALRADLANGPLLVLNHRYPDRATYGPTRRQIDAAVRDLVAANQERGPGWTRVELRRGGLGAAK